MGVKSAAERSGEELWKKVKDVKREFGSVFSVQWLKLLGSDGNLPSGRALCEVKVDMCQRLWECSVGKKDDAAKKDKLADKAKKVGERVCVETIEVNTGLDIIIWGTVLKTGTTVNKVHIKCCLQVHFEQVHFNVLLGNHRQPFMPLCCHRSQEEPYYILSLLTDSRPHSFLFFISVISRLVIVQLCQGLPCGKRKKIKNIDSKHLIIPCIVICHTQNILADEV